MALVAFLPGAGGDAAFWRPVGDRLPADWGKLYFNWPGAGHQPHDGGCAGSTISSLAWRRGWIARPRSSRSRWAASSRCAWRCRIRRRCRGSSSPPRRAVWTPPDCGASDWRPRYRREYPGAASWVFTERADHTADLGRVSVPVLLLWASADAVSPVVVGERLAGLLPDATLHMFESSSHGFVRERAGEVAPLIAVHVDPSMGGRGLEPRTSCL
jgi:poly(3-hydroxyoctanoate) depolymerase